MAYAQLRSTSAGTSRWYAIYFTADGRQRSGGGFSTKRDAERAGDQARTASRDRKRSPTSSRGKLTFAAYVEKYYWPAAQHLEPTTLAAYRSNLDKPIPPSLGPYADEAGSSPRRCRPGSTRSPRRSRTTRATASRG